MTFFNPFRWHLCCLDDGTFAARRWRFGWEWADKEDGSSWHFLDIGRRWYSFQSEAEAREFVANTRLGRPRYYSRYIP